MVSMFRTIALCLLALFALLGAPHAVAGAGQEAGEYRVKAAFLYNFLAFVEWPDTQRISPSMNICVMGGAVSGEAFQELDGRMLGSSKLSVIRPDSVSELDRCQVLYLGPDTRSYFPRIMKAVEGSSILTIGDATGYGRQGAIINFYLEKDKVRYEINVTAAKRAGLTVSAKLLKLAGVVYGVPEGD